MRKVLIFTALTGLLLAALLTVHQGLASVGNIVGSVGWGLVAIVLVHIGQLILTASAWRAALSPEWRVPLRSLVLIRWIRESVNSTLPVAQIGGEVVGARVLTMKGVASHIATASIVVDITYEAITLLLFTLMGLLLYLFSGHRSQYDLLMSLSLAMSAPVLLVFVAAQRRGMFNHVERFLNWLALRMPSPIPGPLDGLHDSIQALYRDRRAVIAGCWWHLLSWAAGAIEVWVILIFIGSDLGLKEAFILESLGQAVRSAAFFVPGGLGVQEGGYMLLGGLFGLTPQMGLGLSLAKRVREMSLGVIGILAWQVMEGHRLLRPLVIHARTEDD